nr:hypothetical protein [Enterocloster clostridioformis]
MVIKGWNKAKASALRRGNSQGYLTGEASFEHPDLQRMLLEEEEVLVSAEGRVDMKRDGWKNTLEDALRLKEMFEREGI